MSDAEKDKNSKKNFAVDALNDDGLLKDLKAACRSLTFISETDADVVPFITSSPASKSLRSFLKALDVSSTDVEEIAFEEFFERLTREREWFGEPEKKRAERFSSLRDVLAKHLRDLRVIRIGRIRIDIYVAGISASGRLVGVETKAIET